MGKFLNWFLADLKGEKQHSVGPQGGAKALTMSPGLASTITNYGWPWNSYSALYRSQPAVRTVVDFLARNIAELRPKVYERNGNDRPEIPDHPLQLLLRSPNPETTDFAHLRNTVADIAIFDRAYWRRYYFRGELKGILRIPPPSIWPEVDKETGHIVYRLTNGERLTRKDLVVFSGYTPDGSDGGVSPLETLRKLLEEESASTLHRAAYWKNAARQSGWIERPLDAPEWPEEARKRFRADMESTMAGAANAGRIGVLEEGMTWNGTAFSPRESEVIESRKLTYEEVCRVYGIPFALIGAMSDSKSNVESFHRQLYQDVLAPWLRFLESEIELQLLPVFETNETRRRRIYVEFNLAAKLAGSFQEQGETLVTAVGVPYMSINEARARLNLPSIDDEAFDEPVKPMNVMYGGQPAVTVPTEDPGTPETLTASVEPDIKAEMVKRYEDSLRNYFGRHEQAVLSKAGQNGNTRPMFADSKLWDRDLTLFLHNWVPHLEGEFATIAKAINDVTYDEVREELDAEGDVRCVFTRAKKQRAAEIARGWAGVESYPLAPKHLPGEHDQDRHGGEGGGSDFDPVSWAKSAGIEVDAEVFDKVAPEDFEPFASAVDDMRAKYEADAFDITKVIYKPGGPGEGARVTPTGDNFKPAAPSTVEFTGNKGKFTVTARSPSAAKSRQDVWVHEMGHVRHNSVPYLRFKAGGPLPLRDTTPRGKSVTREAMTEVGYASKSGKVNRQLVFDDISEYAAKDDNEFFAEVFMLFNRPGGIENLPSETQERLRAFRDAVNRLTDERAL